MKTKGIFALVLSVLLACCAGCASFQAITRNLQQSTTVGTEVLTVPQTSEQETTAADTVKAGTETTDAPDETTESDTAAVESTSAKPDDQKTTTASLDEEEEQVGVPQFMVWTYAEFAGFIEDELVWTSDTLGFRFRSADTIVHTVFFQKPGSMDEAQDRAAAYLGADSDEMEVSDGSLWDYPLRWLSFTIGGNEDTEQCRGAVILTDEGACLFCTETYADFYEEDKPMIDAWMAALTLTDPDRIEPTQYANMTRQEASDLLCGAWVFEDDAPGEDPVIYCFTEDGKVYLSYESYVESLTEEDVFCCGWDVTDGVPCFVDLDSEGGSEPKWYEIRLYAPGDRLEIVWDPETDISSFVDCSSDIASAYLEGTDYDEIYTGMRLGKASLVNEDGEQRLFIERCLWIHSQDDKLIRKYGLENADFDDDYELVPLNREVLPEYDEETIFQTIGFNDDGYLYSEECTADRFLEKVGQYGEMLIEYYAEEGYLVVVSEVYIP